MKKYLFLIALLTFFPCRVFASNMTMIFWYPGEAGSTKEGQPVLDAFFDYINSKMGTSKLSGKYFNTTEDGLVFILKQKPNIGIVSYAAWEANKNKFPGTQIWLATNPLPHGQKEEQYIIVGKTPSPSPLPSGERAKGEGPVFSSEPLSKEFIQNQLGFNQTQKMTPTATPQILLKLKSIAEGTLTAAAILTPNEGATLSKMTAPWTKSLTIIAKSKPVPTARVILFNNPSKEHDSLKKILLNMRNDPAAKEILEELRLTGFSEP